MAVSQALTVTKVSQSAADNTSTVRIKWTSTQTGSSYNINTRTAYYYVSINGGEESEYAVTYTLPLQTTKTIVDTTIVVPHKSDGTGVVAVRTWMDTRISAGVVTKSAELTLDTILQKSTLSAGIGTLGKPHMLTVRRQVDSFTHTITYTCGTDSGTICTNVASESVAWVPPVRLAEQAPDGNSVSVTLTITTYDGNVLVGTSSVPVTCAIPVTEEFAPVLRATLSDATWHEAEYGACVQGRSMLKIDITTEGAYGARIKSVKTTFDGKTYTNSGTVITDVINGAGTLEAKIVVTDSRERTTTSTFDVAVLEYEHPKITALTALRCNEDGTLNPSGDCLLVKFSSAVWSLGGKNTADYYIGYKGVNQSWYKGVSLSDLSGQYAVTDGTYLIPAGSGESYTVMLSVTDSFNKVSATAAGPSAKKVWSLMKKGGVIVGIAVGKVAEHEGYFDIGMPVKFSGGGDCVVEQGEVDGWTYRKWDSGVAECWITAAHAMQMSAAMGGLYTGNNPAPPLNYPFSFAQQPVENVTVTSDAGIGVFCCVNGGNSTSSSAAYNVCALSGITADTTFHFHYHITGRWK